MKWIYVLLLFFAFACSKKDEIAPEIVIHSPTENQVFLTNQTVTIKASVSDNEGIHMVHVIAVDNTGGHWVHSEEHVEGKTFEVNKSFVTNAGKFYTITIEAIDHGDNMATKVINVSTN